MNAEGRRKAKRLIAACHRCHLHKIKCSGSRPCQSCILSSDEGSCEFPVKERKVTISESYLKKLEADSKRLERISNQRPTQSNQEAFSDKEHEDISPALSREENSMLNPIFDGQLENIIYERASEPAFIGEASCAAFHNRILQCLDESYPLATVAFSNYYRVPRCQQLPLDPRTDFPESTHARLLLNVARRFIGSYPLPLLEASFMREVDVVYRREVMPSDLWLCKFYCLLCLGEIYTNRRGVGDNRVPGTDYYIKAVNVFREAFEEPSLLQVEVLILLAWSSNILGRVMTAFSYIGNAMKIATGMGLHRSASKLITLSPAERECRRRTWWVLYFLERVSASKLGQPITIRDKDIDVELPSMDGLTEEEKTDFLDPIPMVANVKLGRIIGNILTDIYGIPERTNGLYIHRVYTIFKKLRAWHDELEPTVRLREQNTPRPVLSLHLAYNECIIQTTRPIHLHLFKAQFRPNCSSTASRSQRPNNFSPITLALADSCVQAAQASSRIAEGLFLDGSLATFGYWDAHHFFSAALILVISLAIKPDAATSDAFNVLLAVLQSMKKDGNVPSVDYCERLSHLQERVAILRNKCQLEGHLVTDGTSDGGHQATKSGGNEQDTPGNRAQSLQTGTNLHHNQGIQNTPEKAISSGSVDIFDNPIIRNFLDDNQAPWPDMFTGIWDLDESRLED
ncbi:unnamed protein product [Clonostachys chloroleuca]|uniref:Zn(2)-C6 fungal-type domain-containing protein n=1 Tax=Clonostachys chloroleuca TaxID=1926264 RepID=A0AA35LQS7_9HYPO|nr:unnamed protein product [Clonostachys chloroleuca]